MIAFPFGKIVELKESRLSDHADSVRHDESAEGWTATQISKQASQIQSITAYNIMTKLFDSEHNILAEKIYLLIFSAISQIL